MNENIGGYKLYREELPDGSSVVRFVRDVSRASEDVKVLARREGLLRTSEGELDRPDEVFRRAEFFFELWRGLGCPEPAEELRDWCREWADGIAGRESFYREAVEFFVQEGPEGHLVGLYHWRDLMEAITWAEVGYFCFYLLGLERGIDWSKVDPAGVKVCVVTEKVNGRSGLNQHLVKYKSSEYLDKYFDDIRVGARYLPLHLLCGYRDLKESCGVIPESAGDSWLLKEVTREEAEKVIEWVVGKVS